MTIAPHNFGTGTWTWDCDFSQDGGKTWTDSKITVTGQNDNTLEAKTNIASSDITYRFAFPDDKHRLIFNQKNRFQIPYVRRPPGP